MKKLRRSIIITAIIFGLFVYFISKNLPVIRETYRITQSHITSFLFLAFLVTFVSLFFITKMYLKLFEMAKLKRTPKEMVSLLFQGLAINIVIPTGGISMAVLFADDAKSRGESPAQAVNGIFLSLLTDYLAISCLLLISLVYLLTTNALTSYVIVSTFIFFLLTFGLYQLSYLASKQSKFLEKGLTFFIASLINPITRLFKRTAMDSKKAAASFINELAMAFNSIKEDPKDMLGAILYSLGSHLSRIGVLYLIFISLGLDPQLRQVLAGYAVGALFVVVSPTPNGIGFVEGSMALLFTSFGISTAAAATAVILYRAFTFWIPFGVGFFLLQRKRIQEIREEALKFQP